MACISWKSPPTPPSILSILPLVLAPSSQGSIGMFRGPGCEGVGGASPEHASTAQHPHLIVGAPRRTTGREAGEAYGSAAGLGHPSDL